jgi:hypothetical protein
LIIKSINENLETKKMAQWQPVGTSYGDPWTVSNGYKMRYKLDDSGDLQEFLLAPTDLTDDEAHQNHVHFWYSASCGKWTSSAKFRNPSDNKLHRLQNLSMEDALWVCKNLIDR